MRTVAVGVELVKVDLPVHVVDLLLRHLRSFEAISINTSRERGRGRGRGRGRERGGEAAAAQTVVAAEGLTDLMCEARGQRGNAHLFQSLCKEAIILHVPNVWNLSCTADLWNRRPAENPHGWGLAVISEESRFHEINLIDPSLERQSVERGS